MPSSCRGCAALGQPSLARPPGTRARLSSDRREQLETTGRLLRDLGHDVVDVKIDYGMASLRNATTRYLNGVRDDVATLPTQHLLEARTRAVARLARLTPPRSLRRAIRREHIVATSMNCVFDNCDVIVTPLFESPAPRVTQCPTRGALRSLRASNTSAWLIPWNVSGQPAIAVPTGIGSDSLPTSVQFVGPAGGEALLLHLASQMECTRPFVQWLSSTTVD